jgi:ABC-2 type transport system ATP-binding protein
MNSSSAISVNGVSHWYGQRQALDAVSFEVRPGEIFILLGPNGGGKSTLFRLLSTLLPLQQGAAELFGYDLQRQMAEIRARIGVVFQSPSVDRKLTVAENLLHQGHLYGISGADLQSRINTMLQRFSLADRRRDRVETLSGGLRRRVELAKGLLHHPRLLLLDEPSTGLDPAARGDMWEYLRELRANDGVTIVLTTHLLEEVDKADRIAIMDRGHLVALDTPDALRATVGGDAITIETAAPEELAAGIQQKFSCPVKVIEGNVRLEMRDGHQWIARLVEAFPGQIESITLGKPTLEDVFIDRTGRRMEAEEVLGGEPEKSVVASRRSEKRGYV